MKNKLVIFILLVIAVLIGSVFCLYSGRDSSRCVDYSRTSNEPFGRKIFHEVMAKSLKKGYEHRAVRGSLKGMLNELKDEGKIRSKDKLTCFIDFYYGVDVHELRDFARDGNVVFVADRGVRVNGFDYYTDDEPCAWRLIRQIENDSVVYKDVLMTRKDGATCSVPMPESILGGSWNVSLIVDEVDYVVEDSTAADGESEDIVAEVVAESEHADVVEDSTVAGGEFGEDADSAAVNEGGEESDGEQGVPSWCPLNKAPYVYKDFEMPEVLAKVNDSTIVAMRIKVGKGYIYMISRCELFTNYSVMNCDKRFLENIMSYADDNYVVWVDEFDRDINENNEKRRDWSFMENWSWLSIILLFLLFAWCVGRRKQSEIPIVTPPKNRTLDFVKHTSLLYQYQKDYLDLVQKKIVYFFITVDSLVHINLNEGFDDGKLKVLAENSQMDKEELRLFIGTLCDVQNGKVKVEEKEMKLLVGKMNEIIDRINGDWKETCVSEEQNVE